MFFIDSFFTRIVLGDFLYNKIIGKEENKILKDKIDTVLDILVVKEDEE